MKYGFIVALLLLSPTIAKAQADYCPGRKAQLLAAWTSTQNFLAQKTIIPQYRLKADTAGSLAYYRDRIQLLSDDDGRSCPDSWELRFNVFWEHNYVGNFFLAVDSTGLTGPLPGGRGLFNDAELKAYLRLLRGDFEAATRRLKALIRRTGFRKPELYFSPERTDSSGAGDWMLWRKSPVQNGKDWYSLFYEVDAVTGRITRHLQRIDLTPPKPIE